MGIDLGPRIKRLRESMGLSQAALARELGVGPGRINHWETGDNQPSLEMLAKLSELGGVTTDWLVRGETLGLSLEAARRLGIIEQAD